MSPTVSVLIACYNASRFVRDAVDSVLAQTWQDLEIIIVDDGSTDESAEILASIIDPRIQVIRQKNGGASAARNAAFAASTGQFVLYFDADDLMGPHHIEALLSRLTREPLCVALSSWDRFYTTPEEAVFPARITQQDLSGVEWVMLSWADAQPMTQSGMFLIPRDLIERYGGWHEDLSLIDDFEFFARIILKSSGVRFVPEARLFYRSGVSDSLSRQKSLTAVKSGHLSVVLGTGHLLDAENSARTRKVSANILQSFDYTYFPAHSDLRADIRHRVNVLGGSTLQPDGPPGFHLLRKFLGWHLARLIQRVAEKLGLNEAARLKWALDRDRRS